MFKTAPLTPFALAWLALPAQAFAVDGVLEINQACAVNTGCFPGDSAGFPVTITDGARTYRLTGDLEVFLATAIEVSARDVTLDLNGMAIISTNAGGSGVKINTGAGNCTIKNGTIKAFLTGVFVTANVPLTRVIDVRAYNNTNYGFLIQGPGSLVRGCTAAFNTNGIRGFPGSTILENVVYSNSSHGFVGNNAAFGSNIFYDNNSGGAQISQSGGIQLSVNQCQGAAC